MDVVSPWLIVGSILSLLIALSSVWVAFYLYRWRTLIIGKSQFVVPEKWAEYLQAVGAESRSVTERLAQVEVSFRKEQQLFAEKLDDIQSIFETFHNSLDNKDKEIARLKKGYDSHVFSKFLIRFIGVKTQVAQMIEGAEADTDNLIRIHALLEDALDRCGVVSFRPDVGSDFTLAGKEVADSPEIRATDQPDDQYKIAEVLTEGYRLSGTEDAVILVPARVAVYRFDQGSE